MLDLGPGGGIDVFLAANKVGANGRVIGVMEKENYLNTIKDAGFKEVEILEQRFLTDPNMDKKLIGKITRIHLKAIK